MVYTCSLFHCKQKAVGCHQTCKKRKVALGQMYSKGKPGQKKVNTGEQQLDEEKGCACCQ